MLQIAFCTTCKNRTQHIEQTLPKNLADNERYAGTKFILVDYHSPDHLVDYVTEKHEGALEAGRLVLYRFTEPIPFRMAHAKNLAHRLGILEGADVLVNLDADNYTGVDFANYVASAFQENSERFLWANRNQPAPVRYPKGCNGRIAVSSRAFIKAGGYDERFVTWGPDDKDFNGRLRKLGCLPAEIPRRYLDVILHNDRMRFREYPGASDVVNMEDEFDTLADATVANYGRFGMGVVFKNQNPVELGCVPTRIFGIGMHKTATTSLDAAFKILGFDSAHWNDAHWAKAIWTDMMTAGRSPTLERHYALSDFPITILYEQLDRAYPGSKFILTVRDDMRWLESVRRHWSAEHNEFRNAWDSDPFTHKIHTEVYGRRSFDPEVMLARYRRHNLEVKAYFKYRPADLLVMDMDARAGWLELCGFLKRPIPSVRYPIVKPY